MFWNSFSNSYCRFIHYGDSERITGINLYRRIKYTHSKWCNIVSMEHGTNNSKYYSEPEFNHNLFGYRNKLQWLFWNSFSNSYCRFIHYGDSERITGINLYRRIKYTYSNWRNIVSVEYRTDNSKYYTNSLFNAHPFCYRNKLKWLFRHSFSHSYCR